LSTTSILSIVISAAVTSTVWALTSKVRLSIANPAGSLPFIAIVNPPIEPGSVKRCIPVVELFWEPRGLELISNQVTEVLPTLSKKPASKLTFMAVARFDGLEGDTNVAVIDPVNCGVPERTGEVGFALSLVIKGLPPLLEKVTPSPAY
jgi:hypothetical protein